MKRGKTRSTIASLAIKHSRSGDHNTFARQCQAVDPTLGHTTCTERPAVESCTILTTEPNELTRQIHDRMPVIVGRAHYAGWLDAAH
jgi:putative SOS response-associated peptidase YedK